MSVKDMRYSSEYMSGTNQADELMIANILTAINSKDLLALLSQEEYKMLLSVVKNHVVMKAEMALIEQQNLLSMQTNRGRFN